MTPNPPSSGRLTTPLKSNYKGFPTCQAKTGHDESRSESSMERQTTCWYCVNESAKGADWRNYNRSLMQR